MRPVEFEQALRAYGRGLPLRSFLLAFMPRTPAMSRIFANNAHSIGNTPLVQINRIA